MRAHRAKEELAKSKDKKQQALELETLHRVFLSLSQDQKGNKADGKSAPAVTADTLHAVMLKLKHMCGRHTVEHMIWECDEDGDGVVCWEEFKSMFQRVRADMSGREPRALYNLVEFYMLDKDESGNINEDECMEYLHRRYGKESLEQRVDSFLSLDKDGDKEISCTHAGAGTLDLHCPFPLPLPLLTSPAFQPLCG